MFQLAMAESARAGRETHITDSTCDDIDVGGNGRGVFQEGLDEVRQGRHFDQYYLSGIEGVVQGEPNDACKVETAVTSHQCTSGGEALNPWTQAEHVSMLRLCNISAQLASQPLTGN